MKLHFLRRGVFLLPFLLTPFLAHSQVLTLLDKAGIALDPLVLHHQTNQFYISPFLEWDKLDQENVRAGKIQSEFSWLPTLKKNGSDSLEFKSREQSQNIFFRIGTQADIEFGLSDRQSVFTYTDPNKLFVELNSAQSSYPMGINYHLLNASAESAGLNFLIKIQNLSQLDYRLGVKWIAQSKQDHSGFKISRWELVNTFCDISDDLTVKELKSDGTGQQVKGWAESRNSSLSFYGEAMGWPGIWSTKANYSWSVPRLNSSEYSLLDSSQGVELGMSLQPTLGITSGFQGAYTYSEQALRTQGIRQPKNSEGSKRFHYALTQSSSHFIFVESPSRKLFSESYLSFGTSLRNLEFTSQPPINAIDQRKETLSYNRLGLSFIADVFGGFSRSAELLNMHARLTGWESSFKFQQNFHYFSKSGRAMLNGKVELKVPINLNWIDFQLVDSTLSQGIFRTDVENIISPTYGGKVLSTTPALLTSVDLLKTSWGHFQIQSEVSQLIFIWNDIAQYNATESSATSTTKNGVTTEYPIFRNGFFGKVQLVVGF